MDNGHKLEVRLKDMLRTRVPALWKRVDSIEERIQDIVNVNTLEVPPYGFVAVEHLPVTFGQQIVVPNVRQNMVNG